MWTVEFMLDLSANDHLLLGVRKRLALSPSVAAKHNTQSTAQ